MRVDAFDFELPQSLIALRPAEPREAARLLLVPESGPFRDLRIRDLPSLILWRPYGPGDEVPFY